MKYKPSLQVMCINQLNGWEVIVSFEIWIIFILKNGDTWRKKRQAAFKIGSFNTACRIKGVHEYFYKIT